MIKYCIFSLFLLASSAALRLQGFTYADPLKEPYIQSELDIFDEVSLKHPELIKHYMDDIALGIPSIADYEEEFGLNAAFEEAYKTEEASEEDSKKPKGNETPSYDFRRVFRDPDIPFLKEIDVNISADPGCTPTHIVCKSPTHFSQNHPAHAAENLLPCWSVFQRYPTLQRVIAVPGSADPYAHSPWQSHMLEIMKAGVGKNDWRGEHGCKVTGHVPERGGGFNLQSGYYKDGTDRFLMRIEDAVQLQVAIGFDTAIAGTLSQLRIGILNRRGPRHWVDTNDFIENTKKLLPNAIVEETYFEGASPRYQAEWIHKQDIILSPHGQQLVNLIWARRCVGVMELFPQGYYIPGFFGAMASVVGGVAVAGYPEGRNPADDTRPALSDGHVRGKARSTPIRVHSESVVRFLNQLVAQQKQCASQYT